MKRIILRAAALSLAFGAVACGATSNDPGAGQPTESENSVKSQDPVGLWGSQDQGQPWLELAEDGKLTGSDGCNRLTGTWQSDGAQVQFGQLASTKMFCEGVDDWLAGAASATVAGSGELAISGQDGKELGTLALSGKDS